MPNRHERRAAEAQTRQSFAHYDAMYRKAFKIVNDRDIGEGWMRGEAADASGIDSMIIHGAGETPPPRDACDIELSAAYGSQRFTAYAKRAQLEPLTKQWKQFLDLIRETDNSLGDTRRDARQFIFEMIVTNQQYDDGGHAALISGAIAWLAITSPVGVAIGDRHKNIHYEISDMGVVHGRKMQNFRLILS